MEKYRGKIKGKDKWVQGNLLYDLDPKLEFDTIKKAWIREPLGSLGSIHEIDINTICKNIERVDINENEAFTSDIIERWHEAWDGRLHLIRGVIFYDISKLEYRMKDVKYIGSNYKNFIGSTWIGHDFKIVGNLIENPEIIK